MSAASALSVSVQLTKPPVSYDDLPSEIIRAILRVCDKASALRLPMVNKRTLAIAKQMPELPWQQQELTDAVAGLAEEHLLHALQKLRHVVRCRTEPLLLHPDTSMSCLQGIAKLVSGCQQKPMLVLRPDSPRSKEVFPEAIRVSEITIAEYMDENIRRRLLLL